MPPTLCTDIESLHERLGSVRPVLAPTMGALHAGHAALFQRARSLAANGGGGSGGEGSGGDGGRGLVVVSIFVNPTQFGPGEDYLRYPRQLERDIALCDQSGVDVVFAPSVYQMYPAGQDLVADGFNMPPLPPVATKPGLEDAVRPTHFSGVVKVVARLFDILQPAKAVFGEKDYQQLRVISQMTREQQPRWNGLEIVAQPTVREEDGLALSSRNAYLSADERFAATSISQALGDAQLEADPASAESSMRSALEAAGLQTEYAVVRDAADLMPIERFDRPCRALVAARIGTTRLIDNIAINGHRP